MSRKSNLENIFDDFYTGKAWYEKSDEFRLIKDDNIITFHGTQMAYIIEEYIEDLGEYKTFVTITLQDFKSDSQWKRARQSLITYCKMQKMLIVYVPIIDMFNDSDIKTYKDVDTTYLMMIKNSLEAALVHNEEYLYMAQHLDTITAEEILIWYKELSGIECNMLYNDFNMLTIFCPESPDIYMLAEKNISTLLYLIFKYDNDWLELEAYEAFENINSNRYSGKRKLPHSIYVSRNRKIINYKEKMLKW